MSLYRYKFLMFCKEAPNCFFIFCKVYNLKAWQTVYMPSKLSYFLAIVSFFIGMHQKIKLYLTAIHATIQLHNSTFCTAKIGCSQHMQNSDWIVCFLIAHFRLHLLSQTIHSYQHILTDCHKVFLYSTYNSSFFCADL